VVQWAEVFPDFPEIRIIKGVNKISESLPEEWLNIVKENESNHKDNIDVFNPILKTDDKLSVMPNTTSRYYELFLSNFTKDYERKSIQKWLDKFPNLNIRTIYRVLNLSFLQSDIREVAYKLFHNIFFHKGKV
jgi:hypothetical protein